MKLILFLAILVTFLAVVPAFATNWTLTDLGYGGACGINDMGQITGYRTDSSGGAEKGFVWSRESGFVDIDASRGQAINNLGQIIRRAGLRGVDGSWTQLSTPSDVDEVTTCAINTAGQVAGSFRYFNSGYEAVMWNGSNEYVKPIPPSSFSSWSYDINEAGTVVGEISNGHAFVWNAQTGLNDLGSFGSSFARADGINDVGQIVGQYNPNGYRHAFLWSDAGGLIDLGTMTGGHHSQATEINNNGLAIGWSMYIAGDPARHPFVWNKDTGMTDLGLLVGGESGVGDINSRNQIVGYFLDRQGLSHIALWEPVPEPSSLLALGAGIASTLGLRKKRKLS